MGAFDDELEQAAIKHEKHRQVFSEFTHHGRAGEAVNVARFIDFIRAGFAKVANSEEASASDVRRCLCRTTAAGS